MRSPDTSMTSPSRSFGWCGITRSATRSARRFLSSYTARSGPTRAVRRRGGSRTAPPICFSREGKRGRERGAGRPEREAGEPSSLRQLLWCRARRSYLEDPTDRRGRPRLPGARQILQPPRRLRRTVRSQPDRTYANRDGKRPLSARKAGGLMTLLYFSLAERNIGLGEISSREPDITD